MFKLFIIFLRNEKFHEIFQKNKFRLILRTLIIIIFIIIISVEM